MVVSQQMDHRRGIDDRRLEIIGIGKGNGHAEAFTLRKPVGDRQEVEHKIHRLPCRDCLEIAFEMIVPGQAEILKGGLSQSSMASGKSPPKAEPNLSGREVEENFSTAMATE